MVSEAEEAKERQVPVAGKAADAVAPAIEDGCEGSVVVSHMTCQVWAAVPYGQPATLIGIEVAGVAVIRIQGDGAVLAAAPGAAVTILVKVEIVHQLIAEAASLGAASVNRAGAGACLVAAARQVVAHIVQFRKAGDLDEAIAIGIGIDGDIDRHQGHIPQAAIRCLHSDEDLVGIVFHQVHQVQAGPAGSQAGAGGADDASLPDGGIPDGGGIRGCCVRGHDHSMNCAVNAAGEVDAGRAGLQIGHPDCLHQAAAARDDDGSRWGSGWVIGAVKAMSGHVVGGSAAGGTVIVGKPQGRQLRAGAQIPGAESLAGRLVPRGRHQAAGQSRRRHDPLRQVADPSGQAAGSAGDFPSGGAKSPTGSDGAIHNPAAHQAAGSIAVTSATLGIARGPGGSDGAVSQKTQQAAGPVPDAVATLDGTRGIAGKDLAPALNAHQATHIVVIAAAAIDCGGGVGSDKGAGDKVAHQAAHQVVVARASCDLPRRM